MYIARYAKKIGDVKLDQVTIIHERISNDNR